ncbi:phosphatidylinositol-4-phosphate 5-kinase [Trypanosoma conorhini]|uniref:Phosphatidylinositol-4-phosphate 5-kinase n=1 Tax=Trypanosoma conorhini TaxID=83891 RepID=A0A3R7PLG9_9TRYP|nr:phosphatidylinositol-4-phosphate 5-kinase [Trypanosoma conorhini]RNF27158.1 phosphatidylinositol-4-phosphate 5-kinase [Trypanosoma conorhini]
MSDSLTDDFQGPLSAPSGYVKNAQLSGNCTYTGQVADDSMHGEGVLTTALDVYTGSFSWGMRHGQGVFRSKVEKHPTGVRLYDGAWNMDERHGIGSIEWCNGDSYEGGFFKGRPHGEKGSYAFADGRLYEGEYRHGVRHGFGRLTQRNGEYYEGEFRDGAMTGKGTGWYAGGKRVYEGSWENGGKVRGKMTFADSKRMYNGDWMNDKPHGTGEMVFANGDHYIGEFVLGKLHGAGSITYHSQDGRTYCGFFMENQPHGKGVLTMSDGSTVVGYFQRGKQLPADAAAAIEQVIQETASFSEAPAKDEPRSAVSTPRQVAATRPPSLAESLADVATTTAAVAAAKRKNTNGKVSSSQPSPQQERLEASAPLPRNNEAGISLPSILVERPSEFTMPQLPSLNPHNALLEPNGSCSHLSKKEEGELLAFSASVIAGGVPNGCKGWLEKFSIGRSYIGRRNWRRRFFVLAPFNTVVSLSYFRDELCRKPVSFLLLNTDDTRVVTRPSLRTHKEATRPGREVCIIYTEKENEYKLLLRADSEYDREYWAYTLCKLFDIIDYPSDFPLLTGS